MEGSLIIIVLSTLFELSHSYHGFHVQPTPSQFRQLSRRQAPGDFSSPGFQWNEPSSNNNFNNFDNSKGFNNFNNFDPDRIFFLDDPEEGNNFSRWPPANARPRNPVRNWNRPSGSWDNNVVPTPSPIRTSTVAVPGMGTTRSSCEDACQITPEYNPVCGTNGITYTNERWLKCAQSCGRRVAISFHGSCPRSG